VPEKLVADSTTELDEPGSSPNNSSIETEDGAAGGAVFASIATTFLGIGGAGFSSLLSTGVSGRVVDTVAVAASCTFSCEPIEMKLDSGIGEGANVAGDGVTDAGFAS
jgi:hypothetical protein